MGTMIIRNGHFVRAVCDQPRLYSAAANIGGWVGTKGEKQEDTGTPVVGQGLSNHVWACR